LKKNDIVYTQVESKDGTFKVEVSLNTFREESEALKDLKSLRFRGGAAKTAKEAANLAAEEALRALAAAAAVEKASSTTAGDKAAEVAQVLQDASPPPP